MWNILKTNTPRELRCYLYRRIFVCNGLNFNEDSCAVVNKLLAPTRISKVVELCSTFRFSIWVFHFIGVFVKDLGVIRM